MNPIKKYYIYKDNQQKGPYSFEELKDLNISRDTMIWYEGLETWIKALEVEELKEIFKSIPPPIQTDKAIPPTYVENISNSNKDLKPVPIYKKKSIITIGVLLFFIITFGAITLYNKFTKQDEIVTKQDEIVIKQEDQNSKIEALEKTQENRNAEQLIKKRAEEAAQRKRDLQVLNKMGEEAAINLRAEKLKLEEIQKFQIGRSSSKKQEQVRIQLEKIMYWEKELDRLKKEFEKYR